MLRYIPSMGFPGGSAGKESACNAGDPSSPGLGKIHWRRDRLPTSVFLGFSGAQPVKNQPAMWETWVQSPRLGRSPGGGHGNPLQYSCLENPYGRRSLAGCSPRGHKELEMTEHIYSLYTHFCKSVYLNRCFNGEF